MRDFMLLVHAATLERSSLPPSSTKVNDSSHLVSSISSSCYSNNNSNNHRDKVILVSTTESNHTHANISTTHTNHMSKICANSTKVDHTPTTPSSHYHQCVEMNTEKTDSTTTTTVAAAPYKPQSEHYHHDDSRIPTNSPLVNDWKENSLQKLHDWIHRMVPLPLSTHTLPDTSHDNKSDDIMMMNKPSKTTTVSRGDTTTTMIRAKHTNDKVEHRWKAMYDCLVHYKEEFGNCEVPARWDPHKSLAYWVVRQRMLYRRNAMSMEKIQKLEQIGFTWGFSLDKYYDRHDSSGSGSGSSSHCRRRTSSRRMGDVNPSTPLFQPMTTTTTLPHHPNDKIVSNRHHHYLQKHHSKLFLSKKQIRCLKELGLRWDCFEEKRVRFQLENDDDKDNDCHPKRYQI